MSLPRERKGSPTLQTHQDPILLLPWLWFEESDQTLTHLARGHAGVPSQVEARLSSSRPYISRRCVGSQPMTRRQKSLAATASMPRSAGRLPIATAVSAMLRYSSGFCTDARVISLLTCQGHASLGARKGCPHRTAPSGYTHT